MRRKHIYIEGNTGSGKTGLLLSLLWQDILRSYHGLAVIDPVGTLIPQTLAFLGALNRHMAIKANTPYKGINERIRRYRDALFSKIYIVDFGRDDLGGYYFNPLEKNNGLTSSELAGDFLRCFERVTQGDLNEQMRRQLILRATCSLIAEAGGCLTDIPQLLGKEDFEIKLIIEKICNKAKSEGREVRLEFVKDYMEQFFAATSGKERRDLIATTWTALGPFLSDERARRFVSVPKGNLDFDAIVNGGRYLLVNLPRGLDFNTQIVLGSMIINRIQLTCERRKSEQFKKDFSLIVDEFHLLFGREWAEAIATVRNKGLNLIMAHQNDSQLLTREGGTELLESVTSNAGTHIIFRVGAEDAFRAAYRIFKPRGLTRKREFEEVSESSQQSRAYSVTKSVSKAIGKAFAVSKGISFSITNGVQVSFSESDGIARTEVESMGLSVSKSKHFAQCVSKSHGVTVTKSDSETIVEGTGTATGNSTSEGESESSGESHGNSRGESSGEGMFYSFSDGSSSSTRGTDAGLMATGMSFQSHNGHGDSSNSGKNFSNSDSSHHTKGKNLSKAISDVISASRALARSKGKSIGTSHSTSKSETRGESDTVGLSKSIANGIAVIESYCKSMGESISQAISKSRGETYTESETETSGQSESEQHGFSQGISRTKKEEYYSVDEDARILSYKLAELPAREAYVLTRDDGRLYHIRTLDIPFDADGRLGNADFMVSLLEKIKPGPVEIPDKPVFSRLLSDELDSLKEKIKPPKGF